MSVQTPQQLYALSVGTSTNSVSVPVVGEVAPTSINTNYPVGKRWINTLTNEIYTLTSFSASSGAITANWQVDASPIGVVSTINSLSPTAGNIVLAGTANQITATSTGSTVTFSLPVDIVVANSVSASSSNSGAANSLEVANSANAASSDALVSATVGGTSAGDPFFSAVVTGGSTWSWGVDNSASDAWVLAASAALGTSNAASWSIAGALTNTGAISATAGDITATNGNFVKGTAGNKDVYSSVATNGTAGANSAGSATLVGGTVTINTTAVTASSLIRIYRQSIGSTGAAALGILSIGTITAATSFVINSVQAADATALQASDVSVVFWEIVN